MEGGCSISNSRMRAKAFRFQFKDGGECSNCGASGADGPTLMDPRRGEEPAMKLNKS